jgi:hypothetical protein
VQVADKNSASLQPALKATVQSRVPHVTTNPGRTSHHLLPLCAARQPITQDKTAQTKLSGANDAAIATEAANMRTPVSPSFDEIRIVALSPPAESHGIHLRVAENLASRHPVNVNIL